MKLYLIKTRLMGDELDQESIIGLLPAGTREEVYHYISTHYTWGEPSWEDQYENGTKARILEKGGDFQEEYLGDQYDQKFSWEDLGELTEKEIKTIKKIGIPFLT